MALSERPGHQLGQLAMPGALLGESAQMRARQLHRNAQHSSCDHSFLHRRTTGLPGNSSPSGAASILAELAGAAPPRTGAAACCEVLQPANATSARAKAARTSDLGLPRPLMTAGAA